MNKRFKQVIYWITLIPPLIDVITGAINGVKKGLEDIKTGNTRHAYDQQRKWEDANRG